MTKFNTIKLEDTMINDYLNYRNLYLNRKYASNKRKLTKLTTINGGLQVKKRKSFLILKDNKPIFISTSDISIIKIIN